MTLKQLNAFALKHGIEEDSEIKLTIWDDDKRGFSHYDISIEGYIDDEKTGGVKITLVDEDELKNNPYYGKTFYHSILTTDRIYGCDDWYNASPCCIQRYEIV